MWSTIFLSTVSRFCLGSARRSSSRSAPGPEEPQPYHLVIFQGSLQDFPGVGCSLHPSEYSAGSWREAFLLTDLGGLSHGHDVSLAGGVVPHLWGPKLCLTLFQLPSEVSTSCGKGAFGTLSTPPVTGAQGPTLPPACSIAPPNRWFSHRAVLLSGVARRVLADGLDLGTDIPSLSSVFAPPRSFLRTMTKVKVG